MAGTRRGFRRAHESVSNAVVSSLVVTPNTNPEVVALSGTRQFAAATLAHNGGTIPQPSSVIAWTRSNAVVGSISATGLFTATATAGSSTVTATHTESGVAAVVNVTVS